MGEAREADAPRHHPQGRQRDRLVGAGGRRRELCRHDPGFRRVEQRVRRARPLPRGTRPGPRLGRRGEATVRGLRSDQATGPKGRVCACRRQGAHEGEGAGAEASLLLNMLTRGAQRPKGRGAPRVCETLCCEADAEFATVGPHHDRCGGVRHVRPGRRSGLRRHHRSRLGRRPAGLLRRAERRFDMPASVSDRRRRARRP